MKEHFHGIGQGFMSHDRTYNQTNKDNLIYLLERDSFHKMYVRINCPVALRFKNCKNVIKCRLAIPQFYWFHCTWPRSGLHSASVFYKSYRLYLTNCKKDCRVLAWIECKFAQKNFTVRFVTNFDHCNDVQNCTKKHKECNSCTKYKDCEVIK